MCLIESSCLPPVPNPILELQEWQSRSSLARIPILALERVVMVHSALKPSLLQVSCKEASGPTTDYHLPRPSEVLQYCPSAISEYRELALLVISIKLIWLLILISRQILEKDVFQEEGSLVSSESKPVLPPSTLQRFLSCHYAEV